MVVADLHVHTTNSDGTMELAEVPAAARRAGVRAVAITDHDRLHPQLNAPVTHIDGVTVLHGIELRVDVGEFRVDVLGYGARHTPALDEELARLQRDRRERGAAIIERVEEHTNVRLGIEAREGLGRPHIARAIAESEAPYDYREAFDELIGNGRPCYVPRAVTDFETGVDLLTEACGLVGLAHPYRYEETEAALALCADLDAVELHYDYGTEVDPRPVERAIREYDLVATGGSDAHDDLLGRAGLSEEEYLLFRSHVRLP
jgi:predicted metal-dependent phosphoesterase TrpH